MQQEQVATYVSPFLGRLDDISTDGVELIQQIAEMFAVADIPTEIIAASVRHPMHVHSVHLQVLISLLYHLKYLSR